MNADRFISDRSRRVRESGIRRIFNLASKIKDPIDLSIGQPDFDAPEVARRAAAAAIESRHNGYTVTQGLPELRERIAAELAHEYAEPPAVLVTSGVSGGLLLIMMVALNPGDEVILLEPCFVSYPNLVQWLDGRPVMVDGYPDFRLDPARVAAAITPRTRLILLNSPNNPTGVVYDAAALRAVCELAEGHDLLVVSDEIYRNLAYDGPVASPVQFVPQRTILLRGFGKSYGVTGWRMGYAAGPADLITQMGNMQQYTFVCAPSIAQHGVLAAMDADMSGVVQAYRKKRDLVAAELEGRYEFARPSGGFYFFLKVPRRYSSGTDFAEAALKHKLLLVPGCVFGSRDTHVRISYAAPDDTLRRGCEILKAMA